MGTDMTSSKEGLDQHTGWHQKRADDMADAMRRYLVGINTGGIGVVIALVAGENGPALGSLRLLVPFVLFVLGIIVIGFSLGLQKHKALKRRDAARRGDTMPDYDHLLMRNQTYDVIAAALFVLGVGVGVVGLMAP